MDNTMLNPIAKAPPSPTKKGEGRAKKRSCFRDEAIRRQAESQLPKGLLLLGGKGKRVDSLELAEPCVLRGGDLKIQEVAKVLAAQRTDHAVIVEDGRMVGIVTDKDLCFRVLAEEAVDAAVTPIKEIMTKDPMCLTVDDGLDKALQLMIQKGFRHIPVVDDRVVVVGMLDIARCVQVNLGKVERAERATADLEAALEAVGKEFGPGAVEVQMGLKERLISPRLSEIPLPPFVAVDMRVSAYECIQRMKQAKQSCALVFDEGSSGAKGGPPLVGIFTTKDALLRLLAAGLDPQTTSIIRVMTPHPSYRPLDCGVKEALTLMTKGGFLHLPVSKQVSDDVIRKDQVVGVVNVQQLASFLIQQLQIIEAPKKAQKEEKGEDAPRKTQREELGEEQVEKLETKSVDIKSVGGRSDYYGGAVALLLIAGAVGALYLGYSRHLKN